MAASRSTRASRRHAGAAPAALLPDRRDGESGQGRVPHVRAAPRRSAPPCPYGRPPFRLWSKPQPEVDPHGTRSGSKFVTRCGDVRYASTAPRCHDRAVPRDDAHLAGLRAQARAVQPRTVALRRALHRRPELGLDLPATRDAVLAALADLPAAGAPRAGGDVGRRGAGGARPGPTVLLRGDMDALPLHEDTGAGVRVRDPRRDARVRARHARRDARLGRPACSPTTATSSRAGCC